MAQYKVVIDLLLEADSEEEAYRAACKYINASQLSRELCDITVEDAEANKAMKSFDDAVID